jgi:hypothetical protein
MAATSSVPDICTYSVESSAEMAELPAVEERLTVEARPVNTPEERVVLTSMPLPSET